MKQEHPQSPSPLDRPLLTNEAARILGVTPETVRHWERVGRLAAVKTANGVRIFCRRDVTAFAEQRIVERKAPLNR